MSSCVTAYFKCIGLEIKESDIFLCGDGYRITYSGDIYGIQVGADAYRAVFRFLKRYRVKYAHGRMNGKEAAEELYKMVQERRMLMIRVDCSYLSYHPVYKNMKAPHWISIIDYESQQYVIADNAIPDRSGSVWSGEIAEEELTAAWESAGYEYLVLDSVQAELAEKTKKIKADAAQKLTQGMEWYFHPKRHLFSSVKEGVESMMSLFRDYQKLQLSDRELSATLIQEMNYRIRMGGAVSYKNVIREKLWELGAEEQVIQAYENVIKEWNRIILGMLKAGLKCSTKLVERLISDTEVLLKKEEDVFIKLQ